MEVGQKLYRERFNRNSPTDIQEVTISRIAKKYIYLEGWDERYPVNKETLKYEHKVYSQHNFQLYRDKQEILDRRERSKLLDLLQKHFNHWSGGCSKNSLDQLRQVAEILGLK